MITGVGFYFLDLFCNLNLLGNFYTHHRSFNFRSFTWNFISLEQHRDDTYKVPVLRVQRAKTVRIYLNLWSVSTAHIRGVQF